MSFGQNYGLGTGGGFNPFEQFNGASGYNLGYGNGYTPPVSSPTLLPQGGAAGMLGGAGGGMNPLMMLQFLSALQGGQQEQMPQMRAPGLTAARGGQFNWMPFRHPQEGLARKAVPLLGGRYGR